MTKKRTARTTRAKGRATPMVRKAGVTRQGGRILKCGGKLKKK